jgi:hypothetical protein
MSALCQKRTLTFLLDHLVGGGEKRRGTLIPSTLAFLRLMAVSYLAGGLHRQLGWFRTPERAAEYVIGNRATGDTIPNWAGAAIQ